MSEPHDARLVPAALVAWVGVAALVGGLDARWLGLAVLVAWCVAAAGFRKRWGGGLVLAGVVAVAACAAVWVADAYPQSRLLAEVAGQRACVEGVVERDPQLREGMTLVRLGAARWSAYDGITCTGEPRQVPGSLLLSWREPLPGVRLGDRLTVTGVLEESDRVETSAVAWNAQVIARTPAQGLAAIVPTLRSEFRTAAAFLPERVRGLTVGMVMGDTSQMSPGQVADMRVSGLAHLTAVSGAHFAIVIAAVVALARAVAVPRWAQALVATAVAVGFTALVFPQPSVVRALSMALAIAIGLAWGRPARAIPALSSGVLVISLAQPRLTHSIGFAMSVFAVAAIVLVAPLLAHRLEQWLVPSLATLIAVPLSAHLAVAPWIVLIDPGVSTYTVIANLAAVPWVAGVTLVGLTAVLLAPVAPLAAHVLVAGAGALAEPIAWVARIAASAPGARLPWFEGLWGAMGLAGVSALIVAVALSRRTRGWGPLGALALSVGSALCMPLLGALPMASAPAEWAVVSCDVGQGDMTLVRSGPTSAVVIDTGAPGAGADRCLRRFGVTSIPLLVLTHPHADHDGAVTEVIATASVNQVWVAPVSSDVHAGSAPSAVQSARIPLGVATPGEVWTFGDARVSVLMADPSPASTADSRLNDGSVVVVAESGGVSVLALGDLEEAGQQRLVERLPASLTVDVVKVAHHGSSRQEAALEAALSYAVAVFSVGQGNSFGHPTSQALDLYSDATVLRTDRCGDIALMRTPQLRQWSGCRLGMGG